MKSIWDTCKRFSKLQHNNFLNRNWLLLVAIIFILPTCNSLQQKPKIENDLEKHHFKETGYVVQEEFLSFFDSYGGIDSLGYPLTDEIIVDGWRVQYFEMGRLEYHPENEPVYRVTVGWLGDLLNRRRPPIPAVNIPRSNTTNQRYYVASGHTLSGDFLHYFDAHGGSVRFGLPISEPYLLEGQLTQDFQSARFFWTPQLNKTVTLEETGRVHLEIINTKNKKEDTP